MRARGLSTYLSAGSLGLKDHLPALVISEQERVAQNFREGHFCKSGKEEVFRSQIRAGHFGCADLACVKPRVGHIHCAKVAVAWSCARKLAFIWEAERWAGWKGDAVDFLQEPYFPSSAIDANCFVSLAGGECCQCGAEGDGKESALHSLHLSAKIKSTRVSSVDFDATWALFGNSCCPIAAA